MRIGSSIMFPMAKVIIMAVESPAAPCPLSIPAITPFITMRVRHRVNVVMYVMHESWMSDDPTVSMSPS